jgi:hypothetical protein
MACARGDEPECGRVVLAPTRPASFKPAFPPKTSSLRPGNAVLTQKSEPGLLLLSMAGTLAPQVDTVQKPGSPPSTVPAGAGGALLALSFANSGEFRFFGGAGSGPLTEDLPAANPGDVHLFSLVSAAPGGPYLVGISSQGELHAVHARTNRAAVGRLSSAEHSQDSWLATFCSPARAGWLVRDLQGTFTVVDLAAGNPAPTLSPVGNADAPDNPVFPPVVFDPASGPAQVFSVHANGDTTHILHATIDGTEVSLTSDDNAAPLGHAAALVFDAAVGGQPRLVVPTLSGTLLWAEPVGETLSITEVDPDTGHQDPLSGVVAVRLGSAGSAPTLFFGDAAGRVFAFRDGAVLPGWPRMVAQGAVTQPPAVVADASGTQLFLVVVSEFQGAGWVTLLGLGTPATTGWALWPEYQHDDANSGCVSAP